LLALLLLSAHDDVQGDLRHVVGFSVDLVLGHVIVGDSGAALLGIAVVRESDEGLNGSDLNNRTGQHEFAL
ncbi:hypothetical protein PENTCL1PPCAC_19605, partial [Pristionchus entomophagus]